MVLAGWSELLREVRPLPGREDHMGAQQNKLLKAPESPPCALPIDATDDDSLNGEVRVSSGRTAQHHSWDSFLLDGVEFDSDHPNDNMYSQRFSHYGGASIYAVDQAGNPVSTIPATGDACSLWPCFTTYSADSDSDGLGGDVPKPYPVAEGDNRLMVMGTEELPGQGLIVVSGAAL
ncbi:MAG: hypothetical protein ACLU9S_11455 [Oscillospiraceae bacterium]